MVTRVLLASLVLTGVAAAQPAPAKLRVGIYAPSVDFGTSQARLAYVQGLAKSIEQATGIKTEAESYATMAALKKGAPEFAIVDGLCYATNSGWTLHANAQIGGSTVRAYGLYASGANSMLELKGKKLAYVQAGCNDAGFIDNAMLDSEVDSTFFSARVGEKELAGAVAAVASYKTAQAVFAPAAMSKGLTKLFDTGNVPNPAFVQLSALPQAVVSKAAGAVVSYGGSGAINGWARPSRDTYMALGGQLSPRKKYGIFAAPEGARLDSKDVINENISSFREPAFVAVRHHFVRPPGNRLE
jgi:hypothetical protein